MDGYVATKEIKSRKDGQAVPVIAVTASTYEEERSQVFAVGCDDFLRKPFREGQIFQILEKHLGVEFIYEDVETAPRELSGLGFEQEILLPADRRHNLLTALEYHDPHRIEASIRALESDYPDLAAHLRQLANEYAYEQIETLIDSFPVEDE